jgi:hypothetical protein
MGPRVWVVIAAAVMATGCAGLRRTHDRPFAVGGVVLGDGKPLAGVTVVIETKTAVYKGVSPLRTATITTDGNGRFDFFYLSHASAVPYVLVFEKEGFQGERVSGAAPPSQNHQVRLKAN